LLAVFNGRKYRTDGAIDVANHPVRYGPLIGGQVEIYFGRHISIQKERASTAPTKPRPWQPPDR
jgi:hypothetical protein